MTEENGEMGTRASALSEGWKCHFYLFGQGPDDSREKSAEV